jgi:Cu(I)-responsive transcriptional regulator
MNIGQASRQSDVSAKMIRHYEAIGLIGVAGRSAAGYRTYDEADVHRLRFIKRARSLGFPIARIKALLGLWDNKRRASSRVKELTAEHIADLKRQIAEMQAMVKSLQRLSDSCRGDGREACPILDDLAAGQQ